MFGDRAPNTDASPTHRFVPLPRAGEIPFDANGEKPMPTGVKARKFEKAAEEKFGETAKVSGAEGVPGGQINTRQQVKVVMGHIKTVNSVATRNLIPKIEFSFDMPANVSAVWDENRGKIVLNAQTSLINPDDLPFTVAHEAAHGGLLKIAKGRKIQAESMADLAAELATGKTLANNYDEQVDALKRIAKIFDFQANEAGFESGEHFVLDLYAKNGKKGGTKLFQALLKIFIEKAQRGMNFQDSEGAANDAMKLFNRAFPDAKVEYTGSSLPVQSRNR